MPSLFLKSYYLSSCGAGGGEGGNGCTSMAFFFVISNCCCVINLKQVVLLKLHSNLSRGHVGYKGLLV